MLNQSSDSPLTNHCTLSHHVHQANQEGKVVVRDLPFPEPEEQELLVKVLYSGVNLSDVRVLELFALKNYALGNEFCGQVLESKNLDFKVGDVVAGCVGGGNTRAWRHSAHQEYIAVKPEWIFKVPENTPSHAAAGFGVVVPTAGDALFNRLGLPLPPSVAHGTPDEGSATPEGALVIWGGATSVGMAATQLARASRVPEITEKVRATLQGTKGTIWGFDALGSLENPVSQDALKSLIPPHDKVRMATVLLARHEGFEITIGGRHFHVEFDLPDGTKLVIPKDMVAADRHWRALHWVIENYGGEYKPTPVRVFEGTGKDAVNELYRMQEMRTFGKVVLKQPLQ
ncbi:hypothetical protein F66182_2078 [Fusarium sp. NRRL 66182]|nr:hypothetical protein F66182_2078 [Fusarium sp. NRRL 66182]